MKKIIFICVIILCSSSFQSNAQLRGSTPKFSHKVDAKSLIRKSNTQKTFAWILMGLSAGLVTTGLVINRNAIYSDFSWGYDARGLTAIPIALGGCGMFGSLALFGASARNKRHAAILLKNETVPVSRFTQRQTAVGLKFSF